MHSIALLKWLPKKVKENDLLPGDRICTDRNKRTYHGIFIGNNRMIHFSKVSSEKGPGKDTLCEHHEDTTTYARRGVRMCCLKCFVREHSLYRFEYGKRLSPASALYRTDSHAESQPVGKVLERANEALDKDSVGEYSVLKNNCETFACFCKTSVRYFFGSKQVLVGGIGVAAKIGAFLS